jgi:hypothetical protein
VKLEVTGTFSQLLSFLDRLESGEPETLILEYLGVETIDDSPEAGGEDTDTLLLKADMNLAIYALLPADG